MAGCLASSFSGKDVSAALEKYEGPALFRSWRPSKHAKQLKGKCVWRGSICYWG
jgi:hypothetical protein